ncbi:MAG: hypothetical protein NZ534_12335, partial [Bacteroidia bacterium]|nr:hypothetical protein [Bacteroidia bacterium]
MATLAHYSSTLPTLFNAISKTAYKDVTEELDRASNEQNKTMYEANRELENVGFVDLVERYDPMRKIRINPGGVLNTGIYATADEWLGLARLLLNAKGLEAISKAGFNIGGNIVRPSHDMGGTAKLIFSPDVAKIRLRAWAQAYYKSTPTIQKIMDAMNRVTDDILYPRVKETAIRLGMPIPPKEEFYQALHRYRGVNPSATNHTMMEILLMRSGILKPRERLDVQDPIVVHGAVDSFLRSIYETSRVAGYAPVFNQIRRWIGLSFVDNINDPKARSWISDILDQRMGRGFAKSLLNSIRKSEGLIDEFAPNMLRELRRGLATVRLAGLGTAIKQYISLVPPMFLYGPQTVINGLRANVPKDVFEKIVNSDNAYSLRARLAGGHFVDELIET